MRWRCPAAMFAERAVECLGNEDNEGDPWRPPAEAITPQLVPPAPIREPRRVGASEKAAARCAVRGDGVMADLDAAVASDI